MADDPYGTESLRFCQKQGVALGPGLSGGYHEAVYGLLSDPGIQTAGNQ